jgi:RimJ/RimL family protein N-acetyltransferase
MFDPVSYHVAEALNDGRKVEIRAQRRGDREALLAAVERASKETLYHRFLVTKRKFSEQEEHFFIDIDYVNHVALVAETIEDGRAVIIGGCRYVVVEPGRAEVAFSVIDAYQRKGLGAALMRRLAAIGREAGLMEFVADVLTDNAPMMKVFKRSGLAMTTKLEGPVFSVSLNLLPPGKAAFAGPVASTANDIDPCQRSPEPEQQFSSVPASAGSRSGHWEWPLLALFLRRGADPCVRL